VGPDNRLRIVTWTASLWVVVFSLLAYSTVNALVPSILGSLALATNVLPWIVSCGLPSHDSISRNQAATTQASVPLLVPNQANLGTAFGIFKAVSIRLGPSTLYGFTDNGAARPLNNCGSVVVNVSSAAIQDRAKPGPNEYDNVFYFLIGERNPWVRDGRPAEQPPPSMGHPQLSRASTCSTALATTGLTSFA
jgi:hypothetical protein